MTIRELITVITIRRKCAKEYRRPVEDDFFYLDGRAGESADERLLRLFQAEKLASGESDDQVINALVFG